MEDFNSLFNYIDDDFTPTGNLCYTNDNSQKLHHIHLQEFYNLRWFIQHLIDKNGYEYGDHDWFNPLSESNWICQTNKHFMKYVIFTLQKMTPEQLKMNPFKPIIKVNPNQELDTEEGVSTKDEEESTTSQELSEQESTSDTPTEASEDSKPIETPQVPTVYITSKHDEDDSFENKSVTGFEQGTENGEKIWRKRTSSKVSQQIRTSRHILLFTSLVLKNGICLCLTMYTQRIMGSLIG